MAINRVFMELAVRLDSLGLVWNPEVGDEVAYRDNLGKLSVLVDPAGLAPKELRKIFLWLPKLEQLVVQLEVRQAIIYHAGLNDSFSYEAIVKTQNKMIETKAKTLRSAFAIALLDLISDVKEKERIREIESFH